MALAAMLLAAAGAHALPRPARNPRALPARPATELPTVPAAKGVWTGWRGNPQHSGYQGLPGRIDSPRIRWRFRLGGKLDPAQALLCPAQDRAGEDFLVVAPAGRLAAFRLDGAPLWERRTPGGLALLGCSDLSGDGRPRILAGSSGLSGAKLQVFEASNGRLLWSSDPGPGSIGTVKLAPADASGRQMFWLSAASSTLHAFSFARGADAPRALWHASLQSFVSDPYSFSSIAIIDSAPGSRRVLVSGARGAVPTIVLDGGTGRELSRARFFPDEADHGFESGGAGQLLQVSSADAAVGPQIFTVSSYPSGSSYMFQGITVTYPLLPQLNRSLDTYPAGLRYVRGSVADFDGDGRPDILVSRFSREIDRHALVLYDGSSLGEEAALQDVFLAGIVSDAHGPLILGFAGFANEEPGKTGRIVSYRYAAGSFEPAAFQFDAVRLAAPRTRDFDSPGADNTGAGAVVLPRSGSSALLLLRDRDGDGKPDTLILADLDSASTVASYGAAEGLGLEFLAAKTVGTPSEQRVIAVDEDGFVLFLDGDLRVLHRTAVGGYFRNPALNGHAFEVAAVAPTQTDGRNDVVVIDSRNRVLRLTGLESAGGSTEPGAETLWDNGTEQELLLVPAGPVHRVAVRGRTDGVPAMHLLDGAGREVWRHDLGDAGTALPLGINFGRFGSAASADLVVSVGETGQYPLSTCALDGGSGATLWCSSDGAFWDAAPAVFDFNRDGVDDVVMNFNNYKGILLDGRTGGPWAVPAVLPQWGNLGWVDYNGAPAVAGVDASGAVRIVNSGDNAHLALLSCVVPADPNGAAVTEVWDAAQSRPDDQRYSAAAMAPISLPDAAWAIGVGSEAGLFQARRGSDGALLWERRLSSGRTDSNVEGNALSSVLAVDVDGDGRVEFVVGGADGWLYALDAASGALKWSLEIGSPLGDPVAADFQNEGRSSMLVPAADGFLYAIGAR